MNSFAHLFHTEEAQHSFLEVSAPRAKLHIIKWTAYVVLGWEWCGCKQAASKRFLNSRIMSERCTLY